MLMKFRLMFVTATSFFECAEHCYNTENSFYKGWQTPSIVNYAFACEVYLKLLLSNQEIEIKKSHKLYDLYLKLSSEQQYRIASKIFNYGVWLDDAYGKSEIEKISNAFVNWRYSYEQSILDINTGYLQALCKVLRDECCETVFNSTWEQLKGKI